MNRLEPYSVNLGGRKNVENDESGARRAENTSAGRLVDARRSIAQSLVANLIRDVVELFFLAAAAL